ncbi:hypothetical protein MJT46_002377 [Ovis ammon polii x Ovis aries]|nr:hypothetical protein MJT46_002377 [Ovis ammon polii x Ovis aries]
MAKGTQLPTEALMEVGPNVYPCTFSLHLISFITYRRDNRKVSGCLEKQCSGSDLKSGVQYFMADYKAESRELDKTFSDSYYLLDEPKPYFQIHFPYDFPVGYVLDAAHSWQNKEQEAKPRGENEHVQFEKLEVQYGWSVATPTLDR